MELLGEFFEKDFAIESEAKKEVLYEVRKAARAILFNGAGEIAFLYMVHSDHHKLPGGGVERDESLETALRREVREETGCDIAVRPGSVGAIIEYRDSKKLLQISYCFLADAVGDRSAVEFTEEERQRGAELEWMRLEDAIAALEKDTPTDYAGQFIRKRDLLFLEKAKELLD